MEIRSQIDSSFILREIPRWRFVPIDSSLKIPRKCFSFIFREIPRWRFVLDRFLVGIPFSERFFVHFARDSSLEISSPIDASLKIRLPLGDS